MSHRSSRQSMRRTAPHRDPRNQGHILDRLELQMFEKDKRRIVSCSAKSADAEVFPFELLKIGNSGTSEHDLVILVFNRGNEHEVIAREIRLHDRANVYNRRVSADQSLGRDLTATQEDGLDLETILVEQSHLFGYPDVALTKPQRWITDADFLQGLATGRARSYGAGKRPYKSKLDD